jgi:hypothetical protein
VQNLFVLFLYAAFHQPLWWPNFAFLLSIIKDRLGEGRRVEIGSVVRNSPNILAVGGAL